MEIVSKNCYLVPAYIWWSFGETENLVQNVDLYTALE